MTVYVCSERDIECGDMAAGWCATCPRTPLDAELPPIDDEAQQFLHYNPNTADLVEWVQNYARAAIAADRAARQPAPPLETCGEKACPCCPGVDRPCVAPAAQAQQRSLDAVDAARYRWLRQWGGRQDEFPIVEVPQTPEEVDSLVDAAMPEAPQPPQGGSNERA